MSALPYLLFTRLKNRLLAMIKNTGSLLGMLLMAVMLVFVVISGNRQASSGNGRDIAELLALVWALYTFAFVQVAKKGLGKGTSLFSMADVNMVFTAPLSSRRVLLYGLMQQLGTSLLMGFFLAFQYEWMRGRYGIGLDFILLLMLGYALTVFCAQLTAMAIYVYASGNDARKRRVIIAFAVMVGACAVYLLARVFAGPRENMVGSLVEAANGMPLSLFPVSGWMRGLVAGASSGQTLLSAAMGVLTIAYGACMVYVVTSSRADYYEDVLSATESSFTAITAAKEGRGREAMPTNVKVGRMGLGGGWGASAFYYKHRLEARRARRFLLDPAALIMAAIIIAFSFFKRDSGLAGIFIFMTYLQFFTAATGRWVRELLLPYVYLTPAPPFAKLLNCLKETCIKLVAEAALIAVFVGAALGLSLVECFALAIARFSFGLLFTSGIILLERLFTSMTTKWLVMMLMIVLQMILSLPGIALAAYVSIAFPMFLTANLRMLLLTAAMNGPVSLLVLYFCRNMLDTAELNNQ